ncbi:MAG TPA: S8 family serine peptidase [Caulobacteraceae bacterium]|jgi:hypothetical protein
MPGISGTFDRTLGEAQSLGGPAARLADARLARLRDLVKRNRATLDLDDAGQPVVRSEVLALEPSADSLAVARQAGFVVDHEVKLPALGVAFVVLRASGAQSTVQAVHRLRRLDPAGRYDFDHLYGASGPAGTPLASRSRACSAALVGVRLGMVDGAVAVGHPAFARSAIEQRSFVASPGAAVNHGTAVASLMVGDAPGFAGSAPGARLYAADVYGAGPAGGSAEAVVRALDWMASNRVPVINVSLVGPANLMLEAAVRALGAKGELLVAPVGNDGPAAPPQYPASYPGVIAVTAVDAKGRLLPEAGRARHVDFAARGAGVTVAKPGGGYDKARGTSFAAPVVAGKLVQWLREPDPARSAQAIADLAARARKAGSALGHGVVGEPSPKTSNAPC